MKAENKAGFAVDDEPDVILFALDFDNCFVSVPLVRIEVHSRNKFDSDVVKQGCKFLTPVSDSHV